MHRTKMNTVTKKHKRIKGFGLIELLIAIALSSVVAIVVVQLFIQSKQSYLTQESLTRAQENGRYAINLLTSAVKSADFWGCIPSFQEDTQNGQFSWPKDGVTNIVNGLPGGFIGVSGQEGAATTGLAGYPSEPDTLTISGVRQGRSYPLHQSKDPFDNGPITINLGDSTASNIDANELLVIADCANAVIFQATNDVDSTVDTSGTPHTATIEHGTTPVVTDPPSPFNNSQDYLSYPFEPGDTTVYQGVSTNVEYTIDDAVDHDGNATTPAVPSLMRSVNGGAAEAVVPGVESMQLMFGEDTDVPYDFQADRYVNAANVNDWESVVSIRISILVRSPDADNEDAAGYTLESVDVPAGNIPADANGLFHTRKVYSTTVSVRNRTS